MHTVPEPRWSLTDMSLAFKGVPWVPCRPSGIWRSAGHTTPETWLRSSSTRIPSVAAPQHPLWHPLLSFTLPRVPSPPSPSATFPSLSLAPTPLPVQLPAPLTSLMMLPASGGALHAPWSPVNHMKWSLPWLRLNQGYVSLTYLHTGTCCTGARLVDAQGSFISECVSHLG